MGGEFGGQGGGRDEKEATRFAVNSQDIKLTFMCNL